MPVAEYLVGVDEERVPWLGGWRGWRPGSDIKGRLGRVGGRKLATSRRRIIRMPWRGRRQVVLGLQLLESVLDSMLLLATVGGRSAVCDGRRLEGTPRCVFPALVLWHFSQYHNWWT
jgi:hypothetical protein